MVFTKWFSTKDFIRDMMVIWNKYLDGTLGGTGQGTQGIQGPPGPPGPGTTIHSELTNLGYNYSGHTGFSPDTHTHNGYLPTTSFNGLNKITVSITAPTTPSTGDLWIDIN
jgi:hypothetical protein